jgi:hypothetical protein
MNSSPEAFGKLLERDVEKWRKAVKASGGEGKIGWTHLRAATPRGRNVAGLRVISTGCCPRSDQSSSHHINAALGTSQNRDSIANMADF